MTSLASPFPYFGDEQITARFWAKVRKGRPDECWVWTASKRNKGYGAFVYTVAGKVIHGRAHRFSWLLHRGPIPDTLFVLHRCDNPACVNPSHLFLGTVQDNTRDMLAKGRHIPGGAHCGDRGKWVHGTAHYNAKLTPESVRRIRADHKTGDYTYSQLAEKYGIGTKHAHYVVNRKVWKHVD